LSEKQIKSFTRESLAEVRIAPTHIMLIKTPVQCINFHVTPKRLNLKTLKLSHTHAFPPESFSRLLQGEKKIQ